MLTDSQQLEVTTDSLEAVNAINGVFTQLLSVRNDSKVILKAVEADPACALAQEHAAAFYKERQRTSVLKVKILKNHMRGGSSAHQNVLTSALETSPGELYVKSAGESTLSQSSPDRIFCPADFAREFYFNPKFLSVGA